jgi:DNA polymerase V
VPLFETPVSAGFPAPTDNYVETELDLNTYLVKHPESTLCVRVKGQSMINAGINSGDMLIVDRVAAPQNNSIVIALVDGEFTVKRITKADGKLFLMPENDSYKPLQITENMKFEVWGVVTYIIKKA